MKALNRQTEELAPLLEKALAHTGVVRMADRAPGPVDQAPLAERDEARAAAIRAIGKILQALPVKRRALAYQLSALSAQLQAGDTRRAEFTWRCLAPMLAIA